MRKLKNISQKSMAEMIYKSQSAYSRMENGELQICYNDLANIAKVLECRPEDLLREDMTSENKNITDFNCQPVMIDNKAIQLVLESHNKAMEQIIALVKEILHTMKNK